MKLMLANKAINNIHNHISSMMKVSAKYGKGMGAMGTRPFNSAAGATYARSMAESMARRPDNAGAMMSNIMGMATKAGMSERHLNRLQEVGGRITKELGGMGPNATRSPLSLKWF